MHFKLFHSVNVTVIHIDSRGQPGWESVDALAKYLVALDRSKTALSASEAKRIVALFKELHEVDKAPIKYDAKSKKRSLTGSWRASRKRSGTAPGQQAAER